MNTFIVEVEKPGDRVNLSEIGKIGKPRALDTFYILETDLSKKDVEELPGVVMVEEDYDFSPDEELKIHPTNSWAISRMSGVNPSKNIFGYIDGRDGKGVDIYVMDTGVDKTHEAIEHADIETVYSYDDKEYDKSKYHGTAVASCIVGVDENKNRIIGVAPNASIRSVRWNFKASDAIKSYDVILDHYRKSGKQAVLNMSFSSPVPLSINSLKKLSDEGIILVASAGNYGSDEKRYPAALYFVISVGSANEERRMSNFSSYGETLDILAPGEDVFVAKSPTEYGFLNGTSFSAPYVAGIIATHIQDAPKDMKVGKDDVMKRLSKGSFEDAIKLTSKQKDAGTVSDLVCSVAGFKEWKKDDENGDKDENKEGNDDNGKKDKKKKIFLGLTLVAIIVIILSQTL